MENEGCKLAESNTCRLCASDNKSKTFPIFEKINSNSNSTLFADGEGLDVLINRYLPIRVSKVDPNHSRVICSSCLESLEMTVNFIKKINEGQEILTKIIKPSLKPRGRPRKDLQKQNQISSTSENGNAAIETNSKPKRTSKPPVRYTEEYLTKSEYDEVKMESEDETISQNKEVDNLDNGSFINEITEETINTISTINKSHSHEESISYSSRQNNLMELAKLNIILDGDEEFDQHDSILQIENFNLSAPIPIPTSSKSVQNSNVLSTTGKESNSNINEQDKVTTFIDDKNGNDSDTSIRTIDFVTSYIKRKKNKKRKKGKRKSSNKTLVCPEPDCQKSFKHSSSLIYHRKATHDAIKQFVCQFESCKKSFSHKQLLINHQFTHSDERLFKCDSCIAKYKSRASLYTHIKSTHTKKKYVCEICAFQFSLQSSLKSHLRIHSGQKPFSCKFCSKQFNQKSNMNEHMRIHTGETPFKCQFPDCTREFTTSSQLRGHTIGHTGEKNYLCNFCGKAFANNENLKYHKIRHTGNKNFSCSNCDKTFFDKWTLKKHFRSVHTQEKPYTCQYQSCFKQFSDPSNFSKHKKIHLVEELTERDREIVQNQIEEISRQKTRIISELPTETEQVVQILNTQELSDTMSGEHHVIYVYPEEDIPIFTIQTITDGNLQAYTTDLNGQYFNLGENFASPTTPTPATTSNENSQVN